jgi:hypothetical protein
MRTRIIIFLAGVLLGWAFGSTLRAENIGNLFKDSDMSFHASDVQNLDRFLANFPNCKIDRAKRAHIVAACMKYNIGIFWALSRMQVEQGVVINFDPRFSDIRLARCFSYGLTTEIKTVGPKFCPYIGFEEQVEQAVRVMRARADEWRPGMKAWVEEFGWVECKTAATFSFHRYNSRWGAASNYGVYNMGNSLFVTVFNQLRPLWDRA